MVNTFTQGHLNAGKALCCACQLGTGRMSKRLFGRARRDQPYNYSRRSLRHCPYCRPVNAYLESHCLTKATCSASQGGGHKVSLSLEELSIRASPFTFSGKATPAHGHTSKEQAGNSAAFTSHKQRNLIILSNFLRIDCSRSLEQN